jgi:multidrug resistance efflux pump
MPAHAQTQVDQTGLKLVDLTVRRSEASASFEVLSESAASEKQRVSLLRHQELHAPASNRVARRMAANGEFVMRGANLLQVFDCSEIVVIALLAERPFARLRTGAPARLKLVESSEVFEGQVTQLLGPVDDDPMTFPHIAERVVSKSADYRVVLTFPTLARRLADGCEAGLPAEVSFPGHVWRPTW